MSHGRLGHTSRINPDPPYEETHNPWEQEPSQYVCALRP